MILRLLVAALLVANLGYWAWTRGGFAVFGLQPASQAQAEPHRLAQQVRPQLLRIGQDVKGPAAR